MQEQNYSELLRDPQYTIPDGFDEVTRDEFASIIHPRDVLVSNLNPYYSWWETRQGDKIGWSWPGWKHSGLPGMRRVYAIRKGGRGRLTFV